MVGFHVVFACIFGFGWPSHNHYFFSIPLNTFLVKTFCPLYAFFSHHMEKHYFSKMRENEVTFSCSLGVIEKIEIKKIGFRSRHGLDFQFCHLIWASHLTSPSLHFHARQFENIIISDTGLFCGPCLIFFYKVPRMWCLLLFNNLLYTSTT